MFLASIFVQEKAVVAAETKGTSRLAGEDRFETAVEISKSGWKTGANTVIIARYDDYADALVSSTLARAQNAPILLTRSNSLNNQTKKEISRLKAKNVILIGGKVAISDKVINELKKMNLKVERVGGEDRFETAALIGDKLGKSSDKAIIVFGFNFPDALAVAPYAAKNGIPIYLTKKDKLPDVTYNKIKNKKKNYIIGFEEVISKSVADKIPNAQRIGGEDRFETSANIVQTLEKSGSDAFVATGEDFPDALAGASLIAKLDSKLLLVKQNKVPDSVKQKIISANLRSFTVLGGEKAVSKKVENELLSYVNNNLSLKATRIYGIPKLEWNAVEGITYQVNKGVSKNKLDKIADNISQNSYVDKNSKAEAPYYYNVSAKKEGKVIYQSNTVLVKANSDTDKDGISNDQESVYKTDVNKSDTDGDGLKDGEEVYSYKTNPLVKDTDKDGLPDGYEINATNTSPLLQDSDNDGKKDNIEDEDNDSLTSEQEYKLKSDPLNEDTDDDQLNDNDEVKQKTNPIDEDTDDDGLEDGMEIKVGTNPLKKDSNNNGVIDGDEKYTVTTSVTDLEKDSNVKPSVTITGLGKEASTTRMTNIEGTEPHLNKDIPGYLGAPFEFKTDGQFTKAQINFSYNPSLVKKGESFRPEIFYFNEKTNLLERLPDQKVDLSKSTVSANVNHFSKYILLNGAKWDEAWGKELTAPKTEKEKETYVDVVFSIDSSGSMLDNDPDDIRKKAAKNFVDKLKEKDRSAVVDFDDYASTTVGLTTDKGKVKIGIDQIDSYGGTDLDEGLQGAIDEIIEHGKSENYKYIIFMTDGDGYYDRSVLEEAKKNNIIIYTIGLGEGVKEDILREIANETGGKYFYASEANQLEGAFDRTAEDTVDFFNDEDHDGIMNYYEKNGLRIGNGEWLTKLDYKNADTDGDTIKDGEELGKYVMDSKGGYFEYSSRPDKYDSDNDALSDKEDRQKLHFNVTDQLLSYVSDAAYVNVEPYIGEQISSPKIRELFSKRSLGNKEFNKLGGWKIIDAEDSHIFAPPYSFDSGLGLLILKKGNVVITSFRGTEMTVESPEFVNDVIVADGGLYLTGLNPQVTFARKRVANMVLDNKDSEVYVTGHSLGGFIAQIIGSEFADNRIHTAFWSASKGKELYNTVAKTGYYQRTSTFNAPGSLTTHLFYTDENLEKYKKTITNYVMYNEKDDEEDFVGGLGYQLGEKYHMKTTDEIKGLLGRHGIGFFMKDPITTKLSKNY